MLLCIADSRGLGSAIGRGLCGGHYAVLLQLYIPLTPDEQRARWTDTPPTGLAEPGGMRLMLHVRLLYICRDV